MIEYIASNEWLRIIVLACIFVVVATMALMVNSMVASRLVVQKRLTALGPASVPSLGPSPAGRRRSAWESLVERIETAGLNLGDTKDDALRRKLVAAGYKSPAAPRIYTLIRLILVIALPLLVVLATLLRGGSISILGLYLFGSIAAVLGLYVPAVYVRARADRRREALTNGFPDCLDLLLVCIEAGQGLEASIDRVAREMVVSHAEVSDLLTATTLRLRAGSSRQDALRRLADESGVDEIRGFSTLLIQSDRLGTSIATTLRVYAAEMRERRKMRAEEKAHRLPVLISIPLVTCMLPVMIGVLMLPAAIRVVRVIIPAMMGGG